MKIGIIAASFLVLGLGGLRLAHADGNEIFAKKCATCHGKDGLGKTKMGEKLKAKDLTSAEVQGLTDADLEKTILDGKKDKATGKDLMPGNKGKIQPDELKDLVKIVRAFKK